jgi:hypothetical protein
MIEGMLEMVPDVKPLIPHYENLLLQVTTPVNYKILK